MRSGLVSHRSTANESLTIALVHTADSGGGAEASTICLQKSLRALGHQCNLYVGTKYGQADDVFEIRRSRSIPGLLRLAHFCERRFGWQYLYHPWFRKLDRMFDRKIDVLHFHSLWSGNLGYADVGGLPRLTSRYPSVLTLRDLWMLTGHCAYPALGCERWRTGCGNCPDLGLAPAIPVDGTRFNWSRKRRMIQRSNLVVTAVSDWMARTAEECPIFKGKSVCTVHNGIDEEVFSVRSREAVRNELGLPQNEFIVMVAGQSIEGTVANGNGAAELAMGALHASAVRPYICAVGHSSARFLATWDGSGSAVPFIREPAELAKYYSAADVVLVASLWETFGRIPAESQMCGTPVVGFATGGIPEIVIDKVTGVLVQTGDMQGLAASLAELAVHKGRRTEMGIAARENAVRRFSNMAIARKYEAVYRSAIAARQGGKH